MKKIVEFFWEPYQIVWSEFHYLANMKKDAGINAKEKGRIAQLQVFNALLILIYSLFFVSFFVYIILLFIVKLYALSGIIVGLLMMNIIKLVQKKKYLKRRNAFIKNDPTLIESE
ncbi:hypothetical protein [Niallia circulans]|uniref:hypothetical protein n=1 Tax=Niallia circulans TaxID=1397 RepID=UPI0026EB7353|nr:hypothetical protein [Niallia circulans]